MMRVLCLLLSAVALATADDSSAWSLDDPLYNPPLTADTALPLFEPIDTAAPPEVFERVVHPLYIRNVEPSAAVLQTNKFWDNFLFAPARPPASTPYHDPATLCYSCRGSPVHAHPYVLAANPNAPFGLVAAHASDADVLYGADASPDPNELDRHPPQRVRFYTNSLTNQFGFSALHFASTAAPSLLVTASDIFSATVKLTSEDGASTMTFPVVRGMSCVTVQYGGAPSIPLLYSQYGVSSFAADTNFHNTSAPDAQALDVKYRVRLSNEQTWLLYVIRGAAAPIAAARDVRWTVSVDVDRNGAGSGGSNGWRIEADRAVTDVWLRACLLPAAVGDGSNRATAEVLYDASYAAVVTGGELEAHDYPYNPTADAAAAAAADAKNAGAKAKHSDPAPMASSTVLAAEPDASSASPSASASAPASAAPAAASARIENVFTARDPHGFNNAQNTLIYSFVWRTAKPSAFVAADGSSAQPLHFAFAHHLDVLSAAQRVTALSLRSTTKGPMRGVVGERWDLVENGLTDVTWLPPRAPDADKRDRIAQQLHADVKGMRDDMRVLLNSGSNYWLGKTLAKAAMLCLIAYDMREHSLATECTNTLEFVFDSVVNHTAPAPSTSTSTSANTISPVPTAPGIVVSPSVSTSPMLLGTVLSRDDADADGHGKRKGKSHKSHSDDSGDGDSDDDSGSGSSGGRHAKPLFDATTLNRFVYDTTWKGIVGARGLARGAENYDFGSSYYNDHHYHFGYFLHAAAILRHLRPAWGAARADYVNALVRDVCNPSLADTHFPRFRYFDWFVGHSWSKGIFDCLDGKDLESTSEEVNFHYGLLLWGHASGRPEVARLANLMLAVARRSVNRYFLLDDRAVDVQPPAFVANRVTGIYFENKCAYTTWFSAAPEHIHGIQMIPVLPVTELVRYSNFIELEWELLWDVASRVSDGWKSVLYANYAAIEKNAAFDALLTAPMFDGLTRTWALFWAATRPFPGTVLPPGQAPADAADAPDRVHAARVVLIVAAVIAGLSFCACVIHRALTVKAAGAGAGSGLMGLFGFGGNRPRRSDYEPIGGGSGAVGGDAAMLPPPLRQVSDFDLGRSPRHSAVPAQPTPTSAGPADYGAANA